MWPFSTTQENTACDGFMTRTAFMIVVLLPYPDDDTVMCIGYSTGFRRTSLHSQGDFALIRDIPGFPETLRNKHNNTLSSSKNGNTIMHMNMFPNISLLPASSVLLLSLLMKTLHILSLRVVDLID